RAGQRLEDTNRWRPTGTGRADAAIPNRGDNCQHLVHQGPGYKGQQRYDEHFPILYTVTAVMKNTIVGTAGHIDHGKTSLVKALTGIDADRLEEEKRRGITIDLGFAHFALPTEDGETLRFGFVDVPGHERFVRNMLAGVGGI